MAKKKDDKPDELVEIAPEPDETPPEPVKPVKKNTLIPAKLFINNLKVKLAKEKVSESLYIAFLSSVKRVDTEANYKKIWDTTFKRK